MPKVAIVSDSVAALSREQIEQYDIQVVPVKILFEDRVYRNGVDLAASEAYQLLDKAPELFATSPSSPSEYADVFRKLATEKRDILCISVSSKLSTAFNAASLAREQIKEEFPEANTEVMDSYNAVAGQALIILAAAKAAAQGKGLAEVTKAAQLVKDRVHVVFLFDTIRYVYRTGRIPKIASQIGSMLSVKPMVTISDGLIKFIGVSRNKHRGIDRLIRFMRQEVGTRPVHVAVMHADTPREGQELKKRISSQFDCRELFLGEFSPIVGYATGRGVLGLAFYSPPDEAK